MASGSKVKKTGSKPGSGRGTAAARRRTAFGSAIQGIQERRIIASASTSAANRARRERILNG